MMTICVVAEETEGKNESGGGDSESISMDKTKVVRLLKQLIPVFCEIHQVRTTISPFFCIQPFRAICSIRLNDVKSNSEDHLSHFETVFSLSSEKSSSTLDED